MQFFQFKSLRSRLILVAIVSALTWSSSITNEFVGYDDIKLIVRNEKVQSDLAYTLNFYWNIVSDSHNVAWTNYPTVIYRPLEWFGSAVGYHIWGPQAWAYHLFVNFSFHILNSILLFFILSKIFGTPLSGIKPRDYVVIETESKPSSKAKSKTKSKKQVQAISKPAMQSLAISWWVPLVIVLIWTVHPLHNEAVNMLTSGVGFLCSTLLCLTGLVINLYVKDLMNLRGLLLIILSWICMFIGYHGSEMTVITGVVLAFIFFNSIMKRDYKSYGYEIPKVLFALTSFLTYYAHRSSIVSEQGEWAAHSTSELFERLLVVSPEIFFHYIRLFFFPAKLCMDEHHNVILANAYTPFHLMCFVIALAFIGGIVYYLLMNKEDKYLIHHRIIGGALVFAGFSISISLNIIPLYCLARDRYTYFFLIGLVTAMVVAVDRYVFTKENVNYKPWLITLVLIVSTLGIRSWVKSWDWHNGERFWSQAVDSVSDLGTKQNWRYRLIQYYIDPGTDTFKADPGIRQKAIDDFNQFALLNRLNQPDVVQGYLDAAKDPGKYILNKYGYIGNKTISSALFFNAATALDNKDLQNGLNYFKLAHLYYPDHFQTNLQLLIHTWGQDPKLSDYLLSKMEKDAIHNSFLAKGFMDGLFFIKHPRTYEYAKLFKSRFPNTQVFQVYLFHAAVMMQDYDNAYQYAKVGIQKYHEDDVFEEYIKQYEARNLGR